MLKSQYKQLKMVGAIPTFFVAFNMIADDLADKIGYRIPITKCPMKCSVDSSQEHREFMKTKKDPQHNYNEMCKAVSEWVPSCVSYYSTADETDEL